MCERERKDIRRSSSVSALVAEVDSQSFFRKKKPWHSSAYKDRLYRFSFHLLEWICGRFGTTIVVANPSMGAEDPVIHVFSGRSYGLRNYLLRVRKQLQEEEKRYSEKDSEKEESMEQETHLSGKRRRNDTSASNHPKWNCDHKKKQRKHLTTWMNAHRFTYNWYVAFAEDNYRRFGDARGLPSAVGKKKKKQMRDLPKMPTRKWVVKKAYMGWIQSAVDGCTRANQVWSYVSVLRCSRCCDLHF